MIDLEVVPVEILITEKRHAHWCSDLDRLRLSLSCQQSCKRSAKVQTVLALQHLYNWCIFCCQFLALISLTTWKKFNEWEVPMEVPPCWCTVVALLF